MKEFAPKDVEELELIRFEELEEIRRIWVHEKLEIEDRLPEIYEEVLQEPYPGEDLDESKVLSTEQLQLLKDVCERMGDVDGYRYETLRSMLAIESNYRNHLKRVGIFEELWKVLGKGVFENEFDAEQFALSRKEKVDAVGSEEPVGESQRLFHNATSDY